LIVMPPLSWIVAGVAAVVALGALGLKAAMTKFQRFSVRTDLGVPPMTSAEVTARLQGKTALVVGGTKGIGAGLALALARHGAEVVISGRTDSDNVLAQLKASNPKGEHGFLAADMTTTAQVTNFAQQFARSHDRLDYLILTVGILATAQREETSDGLEKDFAVSTWSRFVVIKELRALLRAQKKKHGEEARVYVMGFPGTSQAVDVLGDPQSVREYKQWPAHMKTVVMNEGMVHYLAAEEKEFAVFGLNPGLLPTDIRLNTYGKTFMMNLMEGVMSFLSRRNVSDYADVTLPVIAAPQLGQSHTGALFNTFGEPIQPGAVFQDPQVGGRFGQYFESLYDTIVVKKKKVQ